MLPSNVKGVAESLQYYYTTWYMNMTESHPLFKTGTLSLAKVKILAPKWHVQASRNSILYSTVGQLFRNNSPLSYYT